MGEGAVVHADKISGYLWSLFAICLLANIFGGTASTLMSVYLPVVTRDLMGEVDADRFNQVSAAVNSVSIFGWAIGGVIWGVFSDRLGRSRATVLSIGFYGLFTLLTGVTDSWWLVMVCRFLSGFGVGGVLVVTPTFLSEVWPVKTRSIAIGILSIGFPTGIFSAGLIDLLVNNWHQAFWVGALPLTLSLISMLVVRESRQWQSAQLDAPVATRKSQASFDKGDRFNIVVGSISFGAMLIGLWAIFLWLPTWVQEMLATADGQQARGLSMMVLGAGGLAGGFASGWLANAMGHRKAMMLCFAVCFVMSFFIFKANTTFSDIIYLEIGLLALFFGASQGILSAYIPEMFPSRIRATATGLCFNIGRLITGAAVFFIGALVIVLGGYGNAIFTFSTVFIIGLIAAFFSKEVRRTYDCGVTEIPN